MHGDRLLTMSGDLELGGRNNIQVANQSYVEYKLGRLFRLSKSRAISQCSNAHVPFAVWSKPTFSHEAVN